MNPFLFTFTTYKIFYFFSKQIKQNFAQINLPKWKIYLSQTNEPMSPAVELMVVMLWQVLTWGPGPRLNIKTVLSTYGDFHVKDKTAVRTSYL